jgi:hypothetical protein
LVLVGVNRLFSLLFRLACLGAHLPPLDRLFLDLMLLCGTGPIHLTGFVLARVNSSGVQPVRSLLVLVCFSQQRASDRVPGKRLLLSPVAVAPARAFRLVVAGVLLHQFLILYALGCILPCGS